MTDEDAELVALIDNELDEASRGALLARLATDERLRQRYDELRSAGVPIAAALEELLGQAPRERLRAAIAADGSVRQPPGRFAGNGLRQLAAGIAIGLLAAGAVAWVAASFGLLEEPDDWRSAVVQYTNLYTNETFSPLNPDAPLQAVELSALGTRVGANLTPENVALPGLRFTVAFMLAYEGSPLGVIAYVDPSTPGLALHLRRSSGGRADSFGAPGRSVARLVVEQRTEPFGHRPHPSGAGCRVGANSGKANSEIRVPCAVRGRSLTTFRSCQSNATRSLRRDSAVIRRMSVQGSAMLWRGFAAMKRPSAWREWAGAKRRT